MSEQENETESEHAGVDASGRLTIDIEDARGRELRAVDERPPDDEAYDENAPAPYARSDDQDRGRWCGNRRRRIVPDAARLP